MEAPDKRVIRLDERMESSLDSVDRAEERAVQIALDMGFPEEETYRLGYAVREAMVNAVVHGNRYSANKPVHYLVVQEGPLLQITIEDRGSGFDPRKQADPTQDENLLNQSGRGMMLMEAFTDEVRIERAEPGGTRIILRKTLPSGNPGDAAGV